ncbi:YjbH domain-containing protein [Poseidonibacter ostreae]|uniref:YjbH domain-containing protein n=2 Tax=Poseidonibacter ostreae TaxID=2654171 RepID=A0A6L4WUE3_9BACT|nr:YjbH domain-containing protein [Poseidonibacter ostreae]KAB7890116.1 hypothetical protein GBG19_03850 [Poseidonibacter ostreae]
MNKNKLIAANLAVITLFSSLNFATQNNTSNYSGNTGIFETPNTRIMPDWSMRLFLNQDKPYTYNGIAATPLPFLEVNFHMTQIDGVEAFGGTTGYGDYKDKSLSFKLILQEEKENLPSVVFGGDDIWGTGLYTSKYIALGKKISYFDLTLGYAKGRLGGGLVESTTSTNSGSSNNTAFNFMKDFSWDGGKPFGSVVFNARRDLKLMAEYSPIDYEKARANPFTNGNSYDLPDSKINFGAKYSLNKNSNITLSYQRGNQLSFGYSYQFGFSRNAMFPRLADPKWKADEKKLKEYVNLSNEELSEKLANEVAAERMSNVTASVNENNVWLEFDNPRYNSDLKAVGRAISTVDEVAPKNYDTIYATLKEKNTSVKTFKVNRKEYDAYENQKVSDEYIRNALIITKSVDKMYDEFKKEKKNVYKSIEYNKKVFSYNISPVIKTYLNNQDKPLTTKLSASLKLKYNPSPGVFAVGMIQHPLYNDIDEISTDEALETNDLSIRSNMIDYYKYNGTQLRKLTLGYMTNTPLNSLAKIELGYMDFAFAGLDLEWYKTFYNEKFGVGLQYQYMYKRHVDDMLAVYDDLTYDAKFLNLYALVSPKYDLHMGLKVGEFLAGDKGVKIDISRHSKEFTLGAFATITNSDEVFDSESNKGYIDKGIYLKVPLEVFTYKNIKSILNYGLSPWTRDAGKYASPNYSLFPMNNSENNSSIMKKNIQRFKE